MRSVTLSDGSRSIEFAADYSTGFWLVDFKPPIVTKDRTYAESSDSEGRRKLRDRAAEAMAGMKIGIGADNPTDFQDQIDNAHELVESINRRSGTMTVDQAIGDNLTWDIEAIDATGLPGLESPSFRANVVEGEISIECRPYWSLASRALVTNENIGANVDYFLVEDVPGQVRAWAELRLLELSSQDRRHIEIGVEEDVDPGSLAPLTIALPTLLGSGSGFSGSSTTRSGSIAANVMRATISTTPVVICSTDAQPHVGLWRVRSRIYGASISDSATVYVRLAWRVGDAPFVREPWVALAGEDGWFDPLLAVVDIQEIASGTHSWEARIEAYVSTGTATLDVDQVGMMPAANYTCLRAPLVVLDVVEDYDCRDEFNQSAGVLNGKTADIGGTWARSGDGTDYNVSGSGDVTRTATSDTSTDIRSGCFAILGSTAFGAVRLSLAIERGLNLTTLRQGLVARYADTNNFIAFVVGRHDGYFSKGYVYKAVGGSVSLIDESAALVDSWQNADLTFQVNADGSYSGLFDGTEIVSGNDADLRTGDDLDDGKVGMIDWYTDGPAITRTYDSFTVNAPNQDAVLFSDGEALLTHEAALRESEDGYFMGRPPVVAGQYLTVEPATRAGRASRVVIKARRLDVDSGLPDLGTDDTLEADLDIIPRGHLISKVLA